MEKARNLWRDLPQGGSRYGSVLTRLFLLLCLLATTQAGWAQTQKAIYASGYESGSGTWTGDLSVSSYSSNADSIRTGSKSIKLVYTSGTGAKNATQSTGISMSSSSTTYCHIIGWAKAESGNATTAQIGFNSSKKSNAFTLSSTTWTQITYKGNSVSPNTIILYKGGAKTPAFVDDVVAYYNGSNTTDLTAPSAPTISMASTSGIEWTNGSDDGTGATGIQQTLIFKRTSGSADDLTLNDQGIYSLTATEGPSADQSGHWTLIATVAGNATLYSGTLSEGRYAIVHRDLAYNYSAAAYTTVSGGGSTTIAAPTFTFGGSAQAAGSTISSGVHTGDVVTINAETGKYIYADWSSSDNQGKAYAFTNGKSREQTTYSTAISAGGTRVLYAVAGEDDTATGASSDLALLTFTGVTPQDPTFSVAEGSVAKNTSLTLTKGYSEDKIYYTYTTDGSEPADPTASSSEYTSALNLFTADGTTYKIKAVAYDKDGNNPSSVILKTYTTPAAATAYAVTQASTTNGSFTVNPASATEGTTITVTTSPASGYEVNTVTLSTGGSVTKAAENSYTFSMPASAVEVTVTFKAAAAATSAMFDFTDTDWDERGGSDGQKTETKSGITFSITGSGQIRTSVGSKTKFSSGSTFTITAEEGKQITSVVFLQDNSSQRFTPGSECTLTTAGSASPYTHTYTLKAPASSISFTTTGGNVNVFGVTVNYTSADSHTITCATGLSNGRISAASSAPEGTVVTITGTPDASYGLGTVTVTEVTSGNNVATTGTGNTRTFIMPDENVNVTATFVLLPTISKGAEVNGSFTTSPESYAAAGTTVTVNATPASGYSVGTITVTDGSSNPVTVTDGQFTMPNSNVTVNVTFDVAAVSAGDKWNFTTMSDADKAAYKADGTNWNTTGNSSYYYSKFQTSNTGDQTGVISTTIQQIKDLKFTRTSGGSLSAGKVRIYLPTSSADGYLNFNSSNGGLVLPSMTAGTLVTVDFNGTGSSYGIKPTNATTEGDVDITSTITSATRTTTTFKVKADGEVTISANNSNVRIYKITVGEAVDVAEPTFNKADGSGYDGTTDLSVTVTTKQTATSPATATTYWAYSKTALDRDALVAAATAAGNTGETATVAKATVNEQDITLYAVTKYETNPGESNNVTYYSDVVSATYPYTGKVTPSVSASNINIQQGQQRTIEPTITMPDGTAFDPENDTANPELTTIYDYFNFTFQKTTSVSAYVTVSTGGVVNTKVDSNVAPEGTVETVHIVATQKSPFSGSTWPFNGTSFETDVTVTVIAKTDAQTMSYWWDPQFTVPVTDDDFRLDGTISIFDKKTITNGRMIYVKPAEGYTVYVAAGIGSSHPTVSKVSATSKKDGVCYYEYRKNDPTDEYPDAPIDYNGIALLIENSKFGDPSNEWTDAEDNTEVKNFYLSLQAYNAAGDPEGSVVRCTFPLTNDNTKRPGNVTYNPADPDAKRNTAETVLTSGVEGAYVYGKFSSTSTSYNTPTLIQESGINGGQTNVGVFSTEVSYRKISAVQVAKNTTDNYYYIGNRSTNQYDYLFASEIEMTGRTYNTVVTAKDANMSTAEKIDIKSLISGITYYNKDSKKDINIADSIQAHSGETAPVTKKEIDRVTYSIQYFNGAGGTGVTDGTTLDGSVVTIGKHSGYVVVTATYPGGYSKKVNKRTSTTDEATETYTIYITDPSEQIPTITPNSRNFVDEQEVIVQAPETWSALYMVVDNENDPNYSATTATYTSSGDNKNCFLLNAGEYVRLTLTKTSKVRAFAFNPKASSYTIADGTAASKEVTQTYTKLMPLTAPTLSPYGTSENPHIRTVKSQTVIATTNDAVAGLEVYYTLDGSEPTPTTGEKYNGSEKITITAASTTIKAIAYDPLEGRISPVTTGVYIYTGTIAQPVFYVSTNNGSNWDAGHTSGTVTVNPSDLIKIETTASGAGIYYTMDGSTPTSGEAKVYEGAFSIVKNTTGKAIAIKDDASSPITTVEFVLAEDKEDLWEATDETTPSGKLPGNDRYVVYGKSEGNASSKAVKYLTATFGGMDAEGWSNKTIGEKTQGTPLNGVGKYSIRTNGDAWDETGAEVKNTANTLHGKTFALPAQGDFVRFEPERDGDLTIWLLQQGGLHYTDDGDFCNQFIRLRPIYMLDEQGNSIAASSMYSAARLSNNWDDLDVSDTPVAEGRYGNWVPKGGSQNGVVNKFYNVGESEAIYNMYKDYLTTGGKDISAGDPIAPFEVPTGSVKTFLGTLGLNGTGYVMPSGGNVKYTFPVKGGKTYFLFGYRTKLGVRGFQFKPSTGQDVETLSKNVTINDNTSNATSGFDNNICNVTYNRAFTNGKWAAVTFPFNVSVAQMKKVFGDHVDLIHFDNVSGSKINFKRHWYPMIVAGTPVFIKPSQDMGASVEFKGVHIEAQTVNEVSGEGGYKMTGSFSPATIYEGDYYISGGKLAVRKGNSINTNACRSWLTADSNNGARFDLTTGTADAFAEEAWSVIGNPQPFVASDETVVTYINGVQEDGIINNIFDGPTGIYTINGQLIRKDATSLEGLSKGIYIVNGKKIAVK